MSCAAAGRLFLLRINLFSNVLRASTAYPLCKEGRRLLHSTRCLCKDETHENHASMKMAGAGRLSKTPLSVGLNATE
eukprot:scaffold69525_cov17-Tisochrysis_lutea.AAC.1